MTANGRDHIIRAALGCRGVVLAPLLDVAQLARDRGTWRGTIAIDAFDRLGKVLFDGADRDNTAPPSVSAALKFALDDEGRPRVRGTCKVVAPICCSRCAETVVVEVASHLDYRVVATDAEAKRLMPVYDALVSEDACLSPTVLVEDDILLSIPETCCADGSKCRHARGVELAAQEAGTPVAKPLQALGALLKGRGPA